eukprot:TRINITY_DN5499_c0_g1_i6.p2 TRINITY_DN5499_c0_g1~~TRINITY_DN5499_c0_g1_i6.p2  ORF type:complete len:203 (-),score=37.92 TRINITY_DN5499_c0_g1_i6:138-746(-)
MWKGKPNCVCTELEWLSNYGRHLERLRHIKPYMKLTNTFKADRTVHKQFHRKCQDNKIYGENIQLLRRILAIDRSASAMKLQEKNCAKGRSLNRNYRHKVDEMIMQENRSFVNRIMKVKSIYNVRTWQRDHQRHVVLAQNISKEKGKVRSMKVSSSIFHIRRPQTAEAIRGKDKSTRLGRTLASNTDKLGWTSCLRREYILR